MSKPKVYLAGPVTGLSYEGAVDWRLSATSRLGSHNILGLSPMRAKEYLLEETSIGDSYEELVLSNQKSITARDRFDCQRVDLVLINLVGAERVSIGSMIELGWADTARVPVVLVLEDSNVHDHAMVRELAGWRTNDLDSALDVVVAVLGHEAK